MSRSLPLLLLLLLAGCDRPREVVVRVLIPDAEGREAPVPGVEVLALPYDRDSLLAALAARAPSPRPNTAPLDTAFAEFRGPFTAFSTASYRASKLRDTVELLQARLDSLARTAPDYVSLAARRAAAADSLRAVEARRERARRALDTARGTFTARTDSLRVAIRRWEDSTYRDWESIVGRLAAMRREQPVADTTDANGLARFTLSSRPWWIYARSWDAGDPNAEWYWNVPAQGDTIVLSSTTARHLPRYR